MQPLVQPITQKTTRLERAEIAARIPHFGAMCLLDCVEQWDQQKARCRADSHRLAGNPLRAHGRLAAACAIEYAAQAMAVHGSLLMPETAAPRMGFLASVRGATLHAGRLDTIDGDLIIEVERFSSDGNCVLYDFRVSGDDRLLADGRAAVMLNAEAIMKGETA